MALPLLLPPGLPLFPRPRPPPLPPEPEEGAGLLTAPLPRAGALPSPPLLPMPASAGDRDLVLPLLLLLLLLLLDEMVAPAGSSDCSPLLLPLLPLEPFAGCLPDAACGAARRACNRHGGLRRIACRDVHHSTTLLHRGSPHRTEQVQGHRASRSACAIGAPLSPFCPPATGGLFLV